MSARESHTKSSQRNRYYRLHLGPDALAPRHAGSWLLVAVLWCCARLPLFASRALGAGVGYLMMMNRKRRAIVRVNLALCFPALDTAARERLLRLHFVRAGQAMVDFGFLAWASETRLLRKTRFHGLEHFLDHAGKRNMILLAPHMVGLNFGGSMLNQRFRRMFSMMKRQSNPVIDWMLNKARLRFGGDVLMRTQGLRPVIRGLREGMPFYYLPDEDFGPSESVFAPFFGVPTATLATLGRLAKSADAIVVPCFSKILPGGRGYEVILYPPLKNFPTGDRTRDAARMNAAMEEGIREMPEQYLWTFKLFKTRPHGAPPPYPQKSKKRKRG
jgi:Kdo2-lipid IVA lauroyltransferase/acyltransferase